jgi:hypothetical protein
MIGFVMFTTSSAQFTSAQAGMSRAMDGGNRSRNPSWLVCARQQHNPVGQRFKAGASVSPMQRGLLQVANNVTCRRTLRAN